MTFIKEGDYLVKKPNREEPKFPNADDVVDENLEGTFKERLIWYNRDIQDYDNYISSLPRYLISPDLKEWMEKNKKEQYEEGKDFKIVKHCHDDSTPPFSNFCTHCSRSRGCDSEDKIAVTPEFKGDIIHDDEIRIEAKVIAKAKELVAQDENNELFQKFKALQYDIPFDDSGKLAEDVWLFLTDDSLPEKKIIKKEAFLHEVGSMLESLRVHLLAHVPDHPVPVAPKQTPEENYFLFENLAEYGGEIVSTASLTVEDINQARASGRMWVDKNSLGFVWMPPVEKFPETEDEVSLFERWFPLDVELPEQLRANVFFDKMRQRKELSERQLFELLKNELEVDGNVIKKDWKQGFINWFYDKGRVYFPTPNECAEWFDKNVLSQSSVDKKDLVASEKYYDESGKEILDVPSDINTVASPDATLRPGFGNSDEQIKKIEIIKYLKIKADNYRRHEKGRGDLNYERRCAVEQCIKIVESLSPSREEDQHAIVLTSVGVELLSFRKNTGKISDEDERMLTDLITNRIMRNLNTT